jgi:putative transposase
MTIMSYFNIQRGLTLRIGEQAFDVQRLLEKNRVVQLEHVATGAIRTMAVSELQESVFANKIQIVGAGSLIDINALEAATPETPLLVEQLTPAQQREWTRRTKYVKAMRRRGVTSGDRKRIRQVIGSVANEINDCDPPSDSTVIRWLKRYEGGGLNNLALIPRVPIRKRVVNRSSPTHELAWHFLKSFYFKDGGDSLKSTFRKFVSECARRMLSALSELTKPMSWSSFRRFARTVTAYETDRARRGAAYANSKWRNSIGGVYATRPLERVEMDHTELDLYVIDDKRMVPLGRPTLTMLIDSYSKYILALYLGFEGESLGRMTKAIKLALSPKDDLTKAAGAKNEWLTPGMWECLVVDNGLAFKSPQLHRIALAIGCDLEYCPVRKPWFKPTVERYMREIARVLPAEGRPRKIQTIGEPIDPVGGACVMFSDLCSALTKWAVDVHPFEIPERTLYRPIDRLNDGLNDSPAPVVIPGLNNLDIITALEKDTAVRQGGIEFKFLSYRSPELGAMVLRQDSPNFKATMRYDPNDLGSIWVRDPRNGHWITVPCMDQAYAKGTSLQQHRMIRKYLRDTLKRRGAYDELQWGRESLAEDLSRAIKSGKRALKSSRQLAILEGVTSVPTPATVSAAEDGELEELDRAVPALPNEIPTFEAFNLNAADGWENQR